MEPGSPGTAEDVDQMKDRILAAITDQPESDRLIAKRMGSSRNGKHFNTALDSLVASQVIILTETPRKSGVPIKRYSRSPDSDQSEFTEQPNSLSCQPDNDA